MSTSSSNAERIVIVGGGFAGLSAAARLAQAGLPVTVLEASKLGYAASTLNQGWLHSGAWFAPSHPKLAQLCHESLRKTLEFCPDCVEQGQNPMVFFSRNGASDQSKWTAAWDNAGIPHQPLLSGELSWDFPGMIRERISWAFRLPDRSFRPDVLLNQLATSARNAGAEIRPNTFVTDLLMEDRRVIGVAVGKNEEVRARLVILATGAYSQLGFSHLFRPVAGRQSDYLLVCLKTHLRAIRPGFDVDPFCLVDGGGVNHLPHKGTSVFGTNRWQVVADADDEWIDPVEMAIINDRLRELFPSGLGEDVESTEWAGTTVQAMQVDQIQPGDAPLPTIIDHAQEPTGIENVLSIFPGRATLWVDLAERVRTTVLEKFEARVADVSQPPWTVSQ